MSREQEGGISKKREMTQGADVQPKNMVSTTQHGSCWLKRVGVRNERVGVVNVANVEINLEVIQKS